MNAPIGREFARYREHLLLGHVSAHGVSVNRPVIPVQSAGALHSCKEQRQLLQHISRRLMYPHAGQLDRTGCEGQGTDSQQGFEAYRGRPGHKCMSQSNEQ